MAVGSAGVGVAGVEGVAEGVWLGVVGLAVGIGVVGAVGLVGAVGVVGIGLVGAGLVGAGLVGTGLVGTGLVGIGVVGLVGGDAGRLVVGVVVVGPWVADRVGSGPTQGGAGSLGVADGLNGTNGLPTGRFGLVVDLDVPCERSGLGAEMLGADEGAAWVVAVSCDRNGIRNRAPATRARAAAPMLNFRSGVRRRMCRGLDCLTNAKPFAPRPKGSLPIRTLQSKLTVSA